MLSFNKIVNKLCKKRGKLFFKDDIFEFIDPERRASHHTRLNKVVYSLKSQDILLSIKAGVYVIPTDEDLCLNKIDLLEKYYLALLKKIITKTVGSHYFIGGVKSLEFHMKNYEVPEKIYIINRSVNKKVMVGSREIIFKTIMGKINNGTIKKINLYSKLSGYVVKKNIEGIELKIAGLELSLLESTLVGDSTLGIDVALLVKSIKKYSTVVDYSIFYELGRYKYIMSFNRLKEIAKPLDTQFYYVCLDVIKKNGGLFIGEGLRNI